MKSEDLFAMAKGVSFLFLVSLKLAESYTATQLNVPSLDEISQVLREGLTGRYSNVTVEILSPSDVPDLTQYGWVTKGLGINPILLDIGSGEYLLTESCHNSTYNITTYAQEIPELQTYYNNQGSFYGASALYAPLIGSNGEAVNNYKFGTGSSSIGSIVTHDDDDGMGKMEVVELPTDSIGPFGSLFFTDGEMVETIHIHVKTLLASDEERFDFACQKALTDAIDEIGAVGMVGMIRLVQGEVTFHVMNDFVDADLSFNDFSWWDSFFYPIRSNIECITRLLSNDTMFDTTSIGAHTHCYKSDLSQVGHYENDTIAPPNIPAHEFEAYLIPVSQLVRVTEATNDGCTATPS